MHRQPSGFVTTLMYLEKSLIHIDIIFITLNKYGNKYFNTQLSYLNFNILE